MDSASPWHEDDSFWEVLEGVLFPPEKLEAAAEEVDRILDVADVDDGARVLDIPCGVGRHAVAFAERGFEVTGVDATATYLETAEERTKEAGVDVEVVAEDMREFRRPERYDLVSNVYTSFGYFEDRADDERVAKNFYESLTPGGKLVMSLTSKEVIAAGLEARGWTEQDDVYLLEEREVTDDWCWMENRWVVLADGETHEYTVSHRLYSAYELTELLRSVGFESVDVYGGFDERPYDDEAERLVAVAER